MSAPRRSHRAWIRAAGAVALLFVLAACGTWTAPASVDDAPLRKRAVSATKQDVQVSAAVLSSADSQRMLGADINKNNMQPVWIEVQNRTLQPLWLLHSGTDPDYFSPLEVAWSMHTLLGFATNANIDNHLNKLGFKNPVPPGETRAGIVFTNPDRDPKLLNIDLFGSRTLVPFSLFVSVPDDTPDSRLALTLYQYPDTEVTDYHDLASLRAALERLPCCATDPHATTGADPLNVVVVGNLGDIGAALVRRSYRRNLRESDLDQWAFGRRPDVVLRREAQTGTPATSIRAWLTPIRFNGEVVYVAQVGRPVGGRFARNGSTSDVLHGDVDEARNFIVQDMMYSGGLDKLGFVNGVGPAPRAHPRTTLNGALYHTDGLRAVMFFATRPLSFTNVDILDWVPYLDPRESAARKETSDAGK
ncbi:MULTISPECIES: LssY C-terminal domain-containing protein [unclassified Caballeronia]|uniref:LssY C-terminal domain-containing protein n=1 Tax=unclassified Caballeronia TaxID=2646786 RepID=UPI002860943A|nr:MULTISPECIES: LssY C-terminal domain-containing protein [unclassified Caballeronia]MDR5752195.1 LssY C-terminal domain-containing protein [Caballeronia sp. LZ024]MDR5841906.1 LssY C-terminal domain-containing protein [Caballeronia sp. LZ031]